MIEMPRRLKIGKLTLKQGEEMNFKTAVSGKPTPHWVWERKSSANPEIEGASGQSHKAQLVFKNCRRKQRGVYVLHVWNDFGEELKEVEVEVEGLSLNLSKSFFSLVIYSKLSIQLRRLLFRNSHFLALPQRF